MEEALKPPNLRRPVPRPPMNFDEVK